MAESDRRRRPEHRDDAPAGIAAAPAGTPRPPPGSLRLLEARAPFELLAGLALLGWQRLFGLELPRGDGAPVIVYPGLGVGDASSAPLRAFLRHAGHAPQGWRQGINDGPRPGVLDRCRRQLAEVAASASRPVRLVGWSLGGLYARELANERPELVAGVATLGAPFAGSPRSTAAWRAYERRSGLSSLDERPLPAYRPTPRCPTTSIYSRSDGFVAWPSSIESLLPAHAENVRVRASHLGLGVHPAVWIALADRLAQDPAHWHRFVAPARWRWWFPA